MMEKGREYVEDGVPGVSQLSENFSGGCPLNPLEGITGQGIRHTWSPQPILHNKYWKQSSQERIPFVPDVPRMMASDPKSEPLLLSKRPG